MPITLLKEVTRSWILGSFICDAFVTIDLLCCTASILHLVAIALDRYWSITNLDYATKRTPARILILICVIWVTSILISSAHLFPIFRDVNGRPSDQCRLIGNVPYTIISTVGAFYIPLIGMCIIYWKIFQAAKFRIRRRAFNSERSTAVTSSRIPPSGITSVKEKHPQTNALLTSETDNHEVPHANKSKHQTFSSFQLKRLFKRNLIISNHNHPHDIEPENGSTVSSNASQHHNDYQLKPLKKSKNSLIKKPRSSLTTNAVISSPKIQSATNNRSKQDSEDDSLQINSPVSISSTRRLIPPSLNNDSPITVNTIMNPLGNANMSAANSAQITDMPASKVVTTAVLVSANNTNSHANNRTVVTKT
ncbi:unnamed protein product, partial [Adineta ricciae]